MRTRIYQFTAVHKSFADKLNVVIICKYDQKKEKSGHVILFCTEGTLGWEALVDYYRLRFQIEFNFRDAKQHWGLEDCNFSLMTGSRRIPDNFSQRQYNART